MKTEHNTFKLKNIFLIKWHDLLLESIVEKALFSFFIFVTFIFVLIHSLSVLDFSVPNYYSKDILRITSDGSYAEYFQYMLLVGTCYFIILISLIDKKYFFFLPFFIYLLCDDYLRLHDNKSVEFFLYFKPTFLYLSELTTFRLKDFFELAMAFVALFFLFFSFLILKFRDNELIIFMKKFMFSIYSLIFFAVIVDIIGVKIIELIDTPKHIVNTLIYFFEETGEMITCSYIFIIFFGFFIKKKSRYNL